MWPTRGEQWHAPLLLALLLLLLRPVLLIPPQDTYLGEQVEHPGAEHRRDATRGASLHVQAGAREGGGGGDASEEPRGQVGEGEADHLGEVGERGEGER